MSIITDELRPFWTNRIHQVTGKPTTSLNDWLTTSTNYQVQDNLTADAFALDVFNHDLLLHSFAYDISRFGMASIESIHDISRATTLPKSNGWLVIKSYYAAFFAAHAILRMLGVSCSLINGPRTQSLKANANLYILNPAFNINSGFYKCKYLYSTNELCCEKTESTQNGSHGVMWKVFSDVIHECNSRIASRNSIKINAKSASNFFTFLLKNLATEPCNSNASWLSHVRNKINYRQELGVWFPYNDYPRSYDSLHNSVNNWKKDPIEIDLKINKASPLKGFVSTCAAIVSIYRELAIDMEERCSEGQSFHTYGSKAIMNRIEM